MGRNVSTEILVGAERIGQLKHAISDACLPLPFMALLCALEVVRLIPSTGKEP